MFIEGNRVLKASVEGTRLAIVEGGQNQYVGRQNSPTARGVTVDYDIYHLCIRPVSLLQSSKERVCPARAGWFVQTYVRCICILKLQHSIAHPPIYRFFIFYD